MIIDDHVDHNLGDPIPNNFLKGTKGESEFDHALKELIE